MFLAEFFFIHFIKKWMANFIMYFVNAFIMRPYKKKKKKERNRTFRFKCILNRWMQYVRELLTKLKIKPEINS